VQRSVPEVAEATEAMEWLEREPLGYGAEAVRFHKCRIEVFVGEWHGMLGTLTHKIGTKQQLSQKGK